MLARLARWLRVLGHDTTWDPTLSDMALVQRAADEGRILLTCDRRLLRDLRPAHGVALRQEPPLDQLRAVVDALELTWPDELFTRCMLCNLPLTLLDRAAADALMPPGVRGLPGPVRRCPACARVYWEGSHARRMRAALQACLLAPDTPGPP